MAVSPRARCNIGGLEYIINIGCWFGDDVMIVARRKIAPKPVDVLGALAMERAREVTRLKGRPVKLPEVKFLSSTKSPVCNKGTK